MARQGLADPGVDPPPAPLRPLLGFRGRPAERTVQTVREVLDTDADFRGRVAAARPEAVDADPVAALVLRRPEGWAEELRSLVAAADADRGARRSSSEDRSLQRRVDAVEAALAQRDRTISELAADLSEVRGELERARGRRAAADRERDLAAARAEQVEVERDRAVRELAAARREVADVHAELRALRAEADGSRDDAGDATRAAALDDLDAALGDLDRIVARLRDAGGPGPGPVADEPAGSDDAGPTGSGTAARTRRRRRPVAMRRGAVEGTVEGVDQLLRAGDVLVLVDGYNLSMSAWPDLAPPEQRDRVVQLLTDLRARTGAEVHVVFDGGDVGERPSVQVPLGIRVHFSPVGVEADDVLIGVVPTIPVDRPVVVVSSDRRVRDGVRRFGANLVRSAELLGWVRAAR